MKGTLILAINHVSVYNINSSRHTKQLALTGSLRLHVVGQQALISVCNQHEDGRHWELALALHVPVLRMSSTPLASYVFPAVKGARGVVLPPDVTAEEVVALEAFLSQYAIFRVREEQRPVSDIPDYIDTEVEEKELTELVEEELREEDRLARMGQATASAIAKGSEYAVSGIEWASVKANAGVRASTHYIQSHVQPNSQATSVSDSTRSRLEKAKVATGVAVSVSRALVTGAVATANALSEQLTQTVESTEIGQRAQEQSGPRTEAAKNVAKSTIAGLAGVYSSLHTAGVELVSGVAQSAAQLAHHKYGDEVGHASQQAADSVKNLAKATSNMRRVGVKAIAAATVKTSAVDLLSNEEERAQRTQNRPVLDPSTGAAAITMATALAEQQARSVPPSPSPSPAPGAMKPSLSDVD